MRNRRGFYILLGVTVLMVAAAVVSRQSSNEPTASYGPMFPHLGEEVDAVRTVEIATASGSLRLARIDEGWVARSKNDYPADAERARQLVLGISRLQRLEKKTSDPARFAELELTDVDQAGSKAVRVTLATADDTRLASVLVGKTRDFQASGRSRYFVRDAGDNQSWLVEGSLPPVLEDVSNWLEQDLLPGIEKSDFRSLAVRHADGETVKIENDGDAGFRLAGLADGEEISNQRSIDVVADTLQRLALEDVLDAGTVETGEPVVTVEAMTAGGVRITARFTRRDPDYAARLQASYEPEGDQAGGENGSGDAGKQLARDLNARWDGRVFVVSQYALDAIMVRRSELVQGPEPPEDG